MPQELISAYMVLAIAACILVGFAMFATAQACSYLITRRNRARRRRFRTAFRA